jgi:hypothetical protein
MSLVTPSSTVGSWNWPSKPPPCSSSAPDPPCRPGVPSSSEPFRVGGEDQQPDVPLARDLERRALRARVVEHVLGRPHAALDRLASGRVGRQQRVVIAERPARPRGRVAHRQRDDVADQQLGSCFAGGIDGDSHALGVERHVDGEQHHRPPVGRRDPGLRGEAWRRDAHGRSVDSSWTTGCDRISSAWPRWKRG